MKMVSWKPTKNCSKDREAGEGKERAKEEANLINAHAL
jgi:hypothetical protein